MTSPQVVMPPFNGTATPEYVQQCQDAADSAYMRMIWHDVAKSVIAKRLEVIQRETLWAGEYPSILADWAATEFKFRCESGFFDVKRQTGKGE